MHDRGNLDPREPVPAGQRFRPAHPNTPCEDKLAALAQVIDAMGPDVPAVQEVGESAARQDLADAAQGLSGAQAADAA